MKRTLGIDVGTNSVGWALVNHNFDDRSGNIIDLGSRIIPMPADEIGDFNKGSLTSAASQRTMKRGVRRLFQRANKRRERLVRVMKIYGMIPPDWEPNQFASLSYEMHEGKSVFRFPESYKEMRKEFDLVHPELGIVPHGWTVYYLRKKALTTKISLAELAWVILQFNTKRGYHQLRNDEELDTKDNKFFLRDKVVQIDDLDDVVRGKRKMLIHLSEGLVGEYSDKEIPEWVGKSKEFIVTTKQTKDGEKVSLTAPKDTDWTLRKKRTESTLESYDSTLGAYIYELLLQDPMIKIRGSAVHTVDRHWYKEELTAILDTQVKYHPELLEVSQYESAIQELYKHNEAHKANLRKYDLRHLIIEDIIYYQRPLKSKKYLISNCPHESYKYMRDGNWISKPIKVAAKSHPVFQEYRIWALLHNLRIHEFEQRQHDGSIQLAVDVTGKYLGMPMKLKLYKVFSNFKEVSQAKVLSTLGLSKSEYGLNYNPEEKFIGHETRAAFLKPFAKSEYRATLSSLLEDQKSLLDLWHIFYSLDASADHISSAIDRRFPDLPDEVKIKLLTVSGFKKEYASYSLKALRKLTTLMRVRGDADQSEIPESASERISKIVSAEVDDDIPDHLRHYLAELTDSTDYHGLPQYVASYLVYGVHSESRDKRIYESYKEIDLQKLIPQHSLRNPVVEKVLRETMAIVKDVWKAYGKIDEIHVEMGREIKLPNDKRSKLISRQQEQRQANKRAKTMLRELKKENGNINPHSRGHIETFKIFEEGAAGLESNLDDDIKAIRRKGDPTPNEITRYKLWLEQRYRSPYTGQIIPLSQLFQSSYEIEHVIPRGLFYDDSFNNKVICESAINSLKGNRTAYDFISSDAGKTVSGHTVLEREPYENLVEEMYKKTNKRKYENLMRLDPPYGFAQRQLNNTRYIARKLLDLLDPVVREEGEIAARSRNILPMVGGVTSSLRNDWGLHDLWKRLLAPRFQRMNAITGTNDYYNFVDGRIDLSGYETELKRIDHRHHAIDALVIALTSRQHIAYLHSRKSENRRYDLEPKIIKKDKDRKYFISPWEKFVPEAEDHLRRMIVSFKYKHRIINKTVNRYQKYVKGSDGNYKKAWVMQENTDDHWALRQQHSKDTYYGKITVKEYKKVSINTALKSPKDIANPKLRARVLRELREYGDDLKQYKKHLKDFPLKMDDEGVKKVDVAVYNDYGTSVMTLNDSCTPKQLKKIVDPQLRNQLLQHLSDHGMDVKEAFSTNGLIKFNANKQVPVRSVRIMESFGLKVPLGQQGNKKEKHVKGADGTNLFMGVYWDHTAKRRRFESISLSVAVTHQISQASDTEREKYPFPLNSDLGEFLFYLSPGDLVYAPKQSEIANKELVDIENFVPDQVNRIYRVVSISPGLCYFRKHTDASELIKKEFGSQSKSERLRLVNQEKMEGKIAPMIKKIGWKLTVDRLGHVVDMVIGESDKFANWEE